MSDIKLKLAENTNTLESALKEYYDFTNPSPELLEAQRYALLGGGKRIRAFLILQTCEILGGNKISAIPYACAIEMLHASSLIHDDLPCMDNDDYRRGKLSAHKVYGDALALIAGDAMMLKALEVALKNPYFSPQANAKAAEILASHAGSNGMLAGQAMDIRASSAKFDPQAILTLHNLKTAQLVCASVKLGCLAAGIAEDDARYIALIKYAENVGLAFQIVDDILDYENGKLELNSFLSFMSVDEAREYSTQLTNDAINEIRFFDNGTLEDLANYLIFRKN